MQSVIQKAGDAVSSAMSSNQKIADLKKDTRFMSDSTLMTNDHGVKQSNTDIWLSASTADRKGPQLLEDNWAREKVWCKMFVLILNFYLTPCRSIVLIMSVFLSAWYMLVEPVHLELSKFMKAPRMLQVLES